MRDIMFEIPSNSNIEKCIITKATVLENAKPIIIEKSNEENSIKNIKAERKMSKAEETA
jgi:ATP-dependent Clp protease ATP-binding subunit ClpX